MRGQNERAFPAVFQIIEGKFEIVYPKIVATAAPVLPLPASSPLARADADRAAPPRASSGRARRGACARARAHRLGS